MRKLFILTRLDLMHSLIERADMVLYTISNSATPLILLFVWLFSLRHYSSASS
ncbi:MAG TPA: hypothetical protein VJ327_05085 [Patescibacteria group bacterium]|nr:hypothetical protein [Patescibacteria group bacterium]